MLFSLPSGMDLRYSVSPRWAMPTPARCPLLLPYSPPAVFYNGIAGKLIADVSATFLYKSDDPLCDCVWNLIKCLFYKLMPIHNNHFLGVALARGGEYTYLQDRIRYGIIIKERPANKSQEVISKNCCGEK